MSDGIPESSSALANVAQWVQQQNANLQQLSSLSPNMNFGHHASDGQDFHPNGRYGHVQQWGPSSSSHMIPANMGSPQGYQMFGPQPGFVGEMNNVAEGDMVHDPLSKDNLTSQQLQKREQSLANLRKIKEMLLPELLSNVESAGPVGSMSTMGRHGNPDGAMPVDGWPPPLMHTNVGLPHPGMTMSPDAMVGVNCMPRMGPCGRPSFVGLGGIPPNWDSAEQQREWWKLDQDVCMEKYQRQYVQMGMNVPPGSIGPSHSHMGFMQPMQQMHRMPGPMSPSFPGNSAPTPHCGPMAGDPQSMMFAKQAEFGSMISDENFNHSGGLPHERMFPYCDDQMLPSRFGSTGEPFSPTDFSHPIDQMGTMKMPPVYGPQKRKRSADDDVFKRLLPAPSPQAFSYVNTVEGQELMITKQRNHAFHEQPGAQLHPTSSSPPTYQPPPQKPRPSGGKKKKSQPKNTDQKSKSHRMPPAADSLMCPSPGVSSPAAVTTSASSLLAPAAGSVSQTPSSSLVNTSNSDVVLNRASSTESSSIAAPTLLTGPTKSSMNITSPSLANLAKGIDNLSSQIQQNPFRTVQMQENESDVSDVSPADNGSLLPSGVGRGQMSQNPAQGGMLGATGISSHSVPGCNASAQPMTPANPLVSLPGSAMCSASHPVAPRQGGTNNWGIVDPMAVTSYSLQSPRVFPGEGLEGAARIGFPGGGGMSVGPMNQPTFAGMGSSPGTMSSHSGCHPANNGSLVTGNAKIQIQAQTPNTIQYLPNHPSSGGQMDEGIVNGLIEFNSNKSCTKSSLPPFGSMVDGGLHSAMMSNGVLQRPQNRVEPNSDSVHGSRGPRGALSRTGVPLHMGSGMMQDLGNPVLGPGSIIQGMGHPMHHHTSPIIGPSGPMHDQTGPMMEAGSVIGPGGHLMNDLMPMHRYMKPGMMSNGAEFGPMMMMMDSGFRGCDMAPDGVPMMLQRRPMHPDAVMVQMGCPEFGMSHHEPMVRAMQGCNGMGPEMGMMPVGGREPMMVSMQRPELMADKARSNRSRQKARVNETEARIRMDAGGIGMTGSDPSGNQMSGSNQGMMGMEMVSGVGRPEMGIMRPDMMSMSSAGPGGDCVGMMIARGNGMSSDVAMMGSRGVAGSRVGIMVDGPRISPCSVTMHNYGPSRRMMPLDIDLCQSPMMQSDSGMCPPGLRSLVMQSPAVGKSPGPGMAGDPGFGVQYQPFQQTMYSQSQSPTSGAVVMRGGRTSGGPHDVMVRSPYDIMGSGPNLTSGSGMGFGQVQPRLGPPGTL